jgi:hypothetical protein
MRQVGQIGKDTDGNLNEGIHHGRNEAIIHPVAVAFNSRPESRGTSTSTSTNPNGTAYISLAK